MEYFSHGAHGLDDQGIFDVLHDNPWRVLILEEIEHFRKAFVHFDTTTSG